MPAAGGRQVTASTASNSARATSAGAMGSERSKSSHVASPQSPSTFVVGWSCASTNSRQALPAAASTGRTNMPQRRPWGVLEMLRTSARSIKVDIMQSNGSIALTSTQTVQPGGFINVAVGGNFLLACRVTADGGKSSVRGVFSVEKLVATGDWETILTVPVE